MHYYGIMFGEDYSKLDKYREYTVNPYIKWTKSEAIAAYRKIYPDKSDEELWQIIQKSYNLDEQDNILSTINPDSRWDWYEVGGRFSGSLPTKFKTENDSKIYANASYISKIDWKEFKNNNSFPYCYITEKGEWFSCGTIGYFNSWDEMPKKEWEQQFMQEVQNSSPDTVLIVIDFHI